MTFHKFQNAADAENIVYDLIQSTMVDHYCREVYAGLFGRLDVVGTILLIIGKAPDGQYEITTHVSEPGADPALFLWISNIEDGKPQGVKLWFYKGTVKGIVLFKHPTQTEEKLHLAKRQIVHKTTRVGNAMFLNSITPPPSDWRLSLLGYVKQSDLWKSQDENPTDVHAAHNPIDWGDYVDSHGYRHDLRELNYFEGILKYGNNEPLDTTATIKVYHQPTGDKLIRDIGEALVDDSDEWRDPEPKTVFVFLGTSDMAVTGGVMKTLYQNDNVSVRLYQRDEWSEFVKRGHAQHTNDISIVLSDFTLDELDPRTRTLLEPGKKGNHYIYTTENIGIFNHLT